MKTRYPRKLPTFRLGDVRYALKYQKPLTDVVVGLFEIMEDRGQWTFETPNRYVHETGIWFSPQSVDGSKNPPAYEITVGSPGKPEIALVFQMEYVMGKAMTSLIEHFEEEQARETIQSLGTIIALARTSPQ